VHFALIGAVLFALSAVRGEAEPPREAIVIGEGEIANLAALFERTWQRPPTESELDGLIDSRIREEVLYREALAMGLEREDPVIRRRLVQKLEFLTDDLAARRDPTDAELRSFLEANADDYAAPPRVAFRQVFLNSDRRGEAVVDDAANALDALAAGAPPETLGDPILLPAAMGTTPLPQVAASFGPEVPAALEEAAPGRWFGPIRSAYGHHLLIVDAREPGGRPTLDTVRAAVERDWREARRREARDAFYQSLRERYTVTVAAPAAGTDPATRTAEAEP